MLGQQTLLFTEPYPILGSRSSFFSLWYSQQVTKFCKFYLLHLWLYKVHVYVLPISTQTQRYHLLSLQVPTRESPSLFLWLLSPDAIKSFHEHQKRNVNSLWPPFKSQHWVLIVVSLKPLSLKNSPTWYISHPPEFLPLQNSPVFTLSHLKDGSRLIKYGNGKIRQSSI